MLRELTNEIMAAGGEAIYVVTDVEQEADVQRIADEVIRRFGSFDTRVNNADTGMYGKLEDVAVDGMQGLFETNF